ncbi:GNAT family N-acetyltransferase [Arthrobacter sp.]|uniref:GNAT family N-acetyltransferase n=1 Tax=Arthrobacter sp. TaxID=1667 RepID=UPI00289BEC0C|nr:GNAT family N-acetyltransferase [Arthrobacter sp.]
MNALTDELLEIWVTGWARARGYQVRHEGRFPAAFLHDKTNDWEYFALEPSHDEFAALATSARQGASRLFAVVTARVGDLHGAASVYGLSVRSADEVFMVLDMEGQDVEDPIPPDGYDSETLRSGAVGTVLVTVGGEPAARGHVAVVDGFAVYDQISTEPSFRRRGLGSYVMRALTAVALEHDAETGLLISPESGLELYRYLGWESLANVMMFEPRL